jgi:hypothetical protein
LHAQFSFKDEHNVMKMLLFPNFYTIYQHKRNEQQELGKNKF